LDSQRHDDPEPRTQPIRHGRARAAHTEAAPVVPPADPPEARTQDIRRAARPVPEAETPVADVLPKVWRGAAAPTGSATSPATVPPPVPAAPRPAAGPACPRCGRGPLINPETLGLCSQCGYCLSLCRDSDKLPARSSGFASAAGEVADAVPEWVWIALVGVTAIAAVSSLVTVLPLPPFARAVVSTAMIGLGLAMFASAQWWALVTVAPYNARIGFIDVLVISGRLWDTTFSLLPATRRPVWLAAWGIALALCGAFLVGGLTYWLQKPSL
jgi:hypothetical protein